MMVELTEEELQLIETRRADAARERYWEEFRLSVADTAARFFRYLDQAGMEPSFSEFVNGFGYQGERAQMVYEHVLQVRGAIWK